jgi:hypothetical protein
LRLLAQFEQNQAFFIPKGDAASDPASGIAFLRLDFKLPSVGRRW